MNWYKIAQQQELIRSHPEPNELSKAIGLYTDDYGIEEYEQSRYMFDLYHMGNDDESEREKKMHVWWWDGSNLFVDRGKTHGTAFGHNVIGRSFKGRYDSTLGIITIAIPKNIGKVLSEKDLIQAYPETKKMISALRRRFRKITAIYGIG